MPVDASIGRQVTVQERLQVSVRGREPRSFLDLEDELAAGGPVIPEADHDEPLRVFEPAGDRLGRPRPVDAARDELGRGIRVHRPAPSVRADCRQREDRCQVADDVAPVLVQLVGRRPRCRRGLPRAIGRVTVTIASARRRCGTRQARRSSRACRLRGRRRSRARAHRVERHSNAWTPGAPPPERHGSPAVRMRIAQDLDRAERRRARYVPQPVTRIGWPAAAACADRPASPAAGRRGREATDEQAAATPGSASIISVMWYGGPARSERHPAARPRVGRAGQRGVRIEGEVTHAGQHTGAPGDGADDDSRHGHGTMSLVEGRDRRRSGCRLA